VLALLALVVFPVFARAGEIPEYEPEVPGVTNEVVPPTHPKNQKGQHGGQPNAQAEGSDTGPGSSEKETSEGPKGNGTAGGNGNGNGGDNSGGQPSGSESTKPNSGGTGNNGSITNSKELPPAEATGQNASESSGGSSPVVPILIAVVVLAAISIGVVLYRQKQSDKDADADGREPDQGPGSDGRVSSPNAS
jgi:cobalamin biosynthesis Mg chelatase CobN